MLFLFTRICIENCFERAMQGIARRDAGTHRPEAAMELASPKVFSDMPGVLLVPKLHPSSSEGVCMPVGRGRKKKESLNESRPV